MFLCMYAIYVIYVVYVRTYALLRTALRGGGLPPPPPTPALIVIIFFEHRVGCPPQTPVVFHFFEHWGGGGGGWMLKSVFGGMYFYHSMFQCHSQRAVWLKLLVPATLTCCSGNSPSNGAASPLAQKHCAGRGRGGWGGLGGRSGPRVGGLLCALAWLPCARCSVCLLGLLLRACFRLSLPLLGFFTLLQLAPCLVRVCAGGGQLLCPWDRGDKVVSSCWWVRACFIHPETLFQTLSQVFSRRIRPRLAPRTPF